MKKIILKRLRPTAWLKWFLATLLKAVEQAHGTLDQVLAKAKFWQQAATIPMNARQIKVLNRLLDGFAGKLTTSKWAAARLGIDRNTL